jgi:N-carbamoylputrescine amidase
VTVMRVTICELPDNEAELDAALVALRDHHQDQPADLIVLGEVPFDSWSWDSPTFKQTRWDIALARHEQRMGLLKEFKTSIVGTAPYEAAGQRFNRAFLHRRGTPATEWWRRKTWLPDEPPGFEAAWYSAAHDRPDVRQVDACRLAVLTCTELWAMDWVKDLGQQGAHIIASPRATAAASTENWMAAGRVAAIVSGCFSVSSNRRGSGFGGAGWVFGPDGERLAVTSASQPFVTVELPLAQAEAAKSTYPRYALWSQRWNSDGSDGGARVSG